MPIEIDTRKKKKALGSITGYKHDTGEKGSEKRVPRRWRLKTDDQFDWESNLYYLLGAKKWPEDIEWELNTNELQELGESALTADEMGNIGTFQGIVEKLTGDMDTSLPYVRLKGDEPLTQYPESPSHLLSLLEPVRGKDGKLTGARLDSKFRPKGLTGKTIVDLLARKGPHVESGTPERPYGYGAHMTALMRFAIKGGGPFRDKLDKARREEPWSWKSPPDKEWGSLKHLSSPERHPTSSTWEERMKEKKHERIKKSLEEKR